MLIAASISHAVENTTHLLSTVEPPDESTLQILRLNKQAIIGIIAGVGGGTFLQEPSYHVEGFIGSCEITKPGVNPGGGCACGANVPPKQKCLHYPYDV